VHYYERIHFWCFAGSKVSRFGFGQFASGSGDADEDHGSPSSDTGNT